MSQYNIIAESPQYTVVSEYEHSVSTSDAYQSEADLEKEFIHLLGEQGYDYLPIHTEADLISNLRAQLEKQRMIALDIHTDDMVKIAEGEKQNTVQYGDVLFTGSSETPDECGISSVLTEHTDENITLCRHRQRKLNMKAAQANFISK